MKEWVQKRRGVHERLYIYIYIHIHKYIHKHLPRFMLYFDTFAYITHCIVNTFAHIVLHIY
jgi:hypothetical protein